MFSTFASEQHHGSLLELITLFNGLETLRRREGKPSLDIQVRALRLSVKATALVIAWLLSQRREHYNMGTEMLASRYSFGMAGDGLWDVLLFDQHGFYF